MRLGFSILRTGGRASLLGIPSRPFELDFAKDIIFKGAIVQGINGRKMFETWFQMEALLSTGKLNLEPAITHRLKLSDFNQAMKLLQSGEAIKVVMRPDSVSYTHLKKPEEMIRFDLDNETETIKNYRQRVKQAEALGHYALAEKLRTIIAQEQEHQHDLATALGIDVPRVLEGGA